MTIYNMGKGGTYHAGYAHTFHIHGTHFYVMKIGYPSYNGSGIIEKMNPDIPCDDKVEFFFIFKIQIKIFRSLVWM